MNLTHQVDALKDAAKLGVLSPRELREAEQGPVFEFSKWDNLSDEEIEWLASIGVLNNAQYHNMVMWGPFPTWRIAGRGGFIQVYHNQQDKRWKLARYLDFADADEEDRFRLKGITAHLETISGPGYAFTGEYRIFAGDKQRHFSDLMERQRKQAENIITQTWGILGAFCCHVALPSSTVLRIAPAQGKHKSVQWRRARTHYVILTQRQAQHLQKTRRPATEHDVVRAAHWRRAHFRRLSSDKFIHKRGAYVPVRQAWVGPKEWTGTDHKIYRVIEFNKPGDKPKENQ